MSFLLSLMVIASMPFYEIVWENDFIEIELHEAVEAYKYLPSATLTIDGEAVHDPEMFYEVGVDRTFFSVVHSNTVKTHTVKYPGDVSIIWESDIDQISDILDR